MSETLQYEGLGPIAREQAEAAIANGAPSAVSLALLRLALHDPDWEYSERAALSLVGHPDLWVRRNAATALGHIARLHRSLHAEVAIPALLRLLDDPEVHGEADDALDDCEMFLGVRRSDFRVA